VPVQPDDRTVFRSAGAELESVVIMLKRATALRAEWAAHADHWLEESAPGETDQDLNSGTYRGPSVAVPTPPV
jgi:hypothetical protein